MKKYDWLPDLDVDCPNLQVGFVTLFQNLRKMVIANPIFDVVFKRLMENEKVAKFFIATLLEQQIESITIHPQEFTFIKDLDKDDPNVEQYIREKIRERLSINVLRLDFIATIRTNTGELKKVLIEIQKAKNQIDLMRFRNYLAEQYKKEDTIDNTKTILPITTIYILGFQLPEIETPCIKVERVYQDLINKIPLTAKSDFVEKLTHDSFVVQVERITNRHQTRLDKLLSVFEQNNFVDDKKITKEYILETDLEEVKAMTDILHQAGTNPKERKQIEDEHEAWRTIEALYGGENKSLHKELLEKNKTIEEMAKQLEELKRKLNIS